MQKLINKGNIKVISAFDVEEKKLIDFYGKVFEPRMKYLPECWKWLSRSDFYQNRIPLVIENGGQVIAHNSMIPFFISLEGELHTAAWFIDFKILDEYRQQGLGNILIEESVKLPDCCLAFCNEKSIGVVKKIGWIEGFNAFQHFNFIYPFNHPMFERKLPGLVRKILNITTYSFFFVFYTINSYSKNLYKLEKLTNENFAEFYKNFKNKSENIECFTTPVRDTEFVEWRILNSPNRDKYFLYECENFSAIVLINNNHGSYIDILWVSDNSNKLEIRKMVATLGLYGLKNKIAYIRFYTSNREVSDYLKKKNLSKIRHLRFAYFAKDKQIFEKMKKTAFNFELLDGDFEYIR
ncbi:MAG: GNAT family N-acetyltransferase [Prevotellaceae bacterium]|jgi:hypothetical protein|nr:GNAT family N-acetyltransferase [Prevotellaceae bacterium]